MAKQSYTCVVQFLDNKVHISFQAFQKNHLPLWEKWIQKNHVKNTWFIDGYETSDYINQKIIGNGYDYPFVIIIDKQPIGYIQCCDLYAYRTICPIPKGLFTQEEPGTFCMDLFIAEESYLNRGYGTKIVKAFVAYIFKHFTAQKILIDPASNNKRAIHCYEKAGFTQLTEAFDGVTDCTILYIEKNPLPKDLIKNIKAIYGNSGKKWLAQLPQFLSICENEWEIKLKPCFADLSFHYVAPAVLKNKTAVVLKCAPPNKECPAEIAALNHFSGNRAVKLLQHNTDQGKILLEHIVPGYSLETLKNTEEAVQVSVIVMNALHQPINLHTSFSHISEWLAGFDVLYQAFQGKTGPFPKKLVDQAYALSKELLASIGKPVLLHGDLHYGNILFSNQRDWLAIDPKGVIGEREYEIPLPKLASTLNKQQLKNNINWFIAATGFDKERIISWLFVKMMLAAWWSFEDTGTIWQPFLSCAEMIQNIKTSL